MEPSDQQLREWMEEALREAERGMAEGEVPIGCVILMDDRIVARGHNMVNALGRKTAHAEMVTFETAARDGSLPLDAANVTLVSTLEPCVMCLGACMESGVTQVIFGLEAPADNGTQRVKPPESPESRAPTIRGGIDADRSRELFERWLSDHGHTEQAKFVRQLLELTTGAPARG